MKKRIGFLSYWGTSRGLANVTLNLVKMCQDEYDCFILKQGLNHIAKECEGTKVNIQEYPEYFVDANTFINWITENKLDAVVFNEYNQWSIDKNNLPLIAKDLGCKTYGVLVMERFLPEHAQMYDKILVSSLSFKRLCRQYKVRNAVHIPYSIDLKEFSPRVTPAHEFTFFHPGGMGGVHNRKNTEAVIKAFLELNNDKAKLVITSQKKLNLSIKNDNITIIEGNLDREALIDEYYKANAIVLPSKWETIGIPILESLASGKPVITTDSPPMNEFIRPGLNGYLVGGTIKQYEGIMINALDADIKDLKNKMEMIMNEFVYSTLCKNSRNIIEKIYDLENNKKIFIEFLNGELK